MVQMETITQTMMPIMIFQELELALPNLEKDQHAMHQTGQLSIGNLFLVMEEKSKTPKRDSEKDKLLDQMLSQLDLDNLSIVLILLSHLFMKEIKQL